MHHVSSLVAQKRNFCYLQKRKRKKQDCHYFRHANLQEMKGMLGAHTHELIHMSTHHLSIQS